jgi:hypothetical protein
VSPTTKAYNYVIAGAIRKASKDTKKKTKKEFEEFLGVQIEQGADDEEKTETENPPAGGAPTGGTT